MYIIFKVAVKVDQVDMDVDNQGPTDQNQLVPKFPNLGPIRSDRSQDLAVRGSLWTTWTQLTSPLSADIDLLSFKVNLTLVT